MPPADRKHYNEDYIVYVVKVNIYINNLSHHFITENQCVRCCCFFSLVNLLNYYECVSDGTEGGLVSTVPAGERTSALRMSDREMTPSMLEDSSTTTNLCTCTRVRRAILLLILFKHSFIQTETNPGFCHIKISKLSLNPCLIFLLLL